MNFAIFNQLFIVNLTKFRIKNAQDYLSIFDIIIVLKLRISFGSNQV